MSIKKEIPPKEEIQRYYSNFGVTISELARKYNTSNPTVRKWLDFYGIKRKDQKTASTEVNMLKNKTMPNKKELLSLYEKMSIKELEDFYGVGQNTIYNWLQFHDIEIKSLSSACSQSKMMKYKDIQFSKEELIKLYDITKNLEFNADVFDVSVSHMKKLLKKYDIKLPVKYRSQEEIDLYEYCVNTYPQYDWTHSDKSVINPYELDIVNHTKKIAIEYCGLYWHSESGGNKNRRYHKNKYVLCKENGYRLITIFESDDKTKVKNSIRNLMGENKRVYARNTNIKEITSNISREFLEKNHMNGFVGASYHYGLFKDEELLMVMTFGKSRYDKEYEYEIIRMASKENTTVVGGASKIFKTFIKEKNVLSCMTFADLRYGEGKVYERCGFSYITHTEPNYWYFHKSNNKKLYSRVKFQKHKLCDILDSYNKDFTEYENMLKNGWDRIWDCGNAKYGWKMT